MGVMHKHVGLLDENGATYGVKHIENRMEVSATSHGHEIAAGTIPGHFALHKFGSNADVGATEEVMMTQGGRINYLAAAEKPKIRSSSGDDNGSVGPGVGAWTVTVSGLDANFVEQSETVTLLGVAPVELENAYIRVFRMFVATASTPTNKNVGTVTLYQNDNATSMIVIDAAVGQTQFTAWTVPAGFTFFMASFGMSERAAKRAISRIYMRDTQTANSVFRLQEEIAVVASTASRVFSVPLVFTEKTDIELAVTSGAAAANCTGFFEGWYE